MSEDRPLDSPDPKAVHHNRPGRAPRPMCAERQLRDHETRMSTTPRIGDAVEDLRFLGSDNVAVRLSDRPGPLVLLFLRHLR